MIKQDNIQLFEKKKMRTVWDDNTENWYLSIVDVVEILTESVNPSDYTKKMKRREPMLAQGWGQIVAPLSIQTSGGKQRGKDSNIAQYQVS